MEKTWEGKSAADLMARSKSKFALARARISQRMGDLALLSLLGSLDDGVRGALLLQGNPAAIAPDWETIIVALQDEPAYPALAREEAERTRRIWQLCSRIASGEAITIPIERVITYQKFVAMLLMRYGILVVIPDDDTPEIAITDDTHLDRLLNEALPTVSPSPSSPVPSASFLLRYRTHLLPAFLILVLFAIGSAGMIFWQQMRMTGHTPLITTTTPSPAMLPPTAPTGVVSPSGTIAITSTNPITKLQETTASPKTLAIGKTSYVRTDVSNGLALRSEPGLDETIPILLYLNPDTAVLVVDGPSQTDGYRWWKVRAANLEGWCAGEFLEVR